MDMGHPCGLDPTQDPLDASLIEDMSRFLIMETRMAGKLLKVKIFAKRYLTHH